MARMMDIEADLYPAEKAAAYAIRIAAEALQDVLYSRVDSAMPLPDEMKELLTKLYRGLKRVTEHYFGSDSNLVWNAPGPGKPFPPAK